MAVYVVTYDLNKETKRPDILADIRQGSWAKLSESSYAIETSETPDEVRTRLSRHIDDNDNLYIISLKRPYSGRGPKEVNQWLADNLPWA